MAINSSVKIELLNALNYLCFSSEDFFFQDNSALFTNINLRYRFNDDYLFNLKILKVDSIEIRISPGSLLTEETINTENKKDIFSTIKVWLHCIEKDITASPAIRKLNEQNLKFQENLNNLEEVINKSNLDNHFTRGESKDVIKRLDELEELFKQKLSEEHDNQRNLNSEVKKLTSEISLLKSQLDFLTKGNWLKSLFTKTFNWGKRNPKTALAIGKMAYGLLPEEVKSHIPEQLLELEVGDGTLDTNSLDAASGE